MHGASLCCAQGQQPDRTQGAEHRTDDFVVILKAAFSRHQGKIMKAAFFQSG